MVNSAHCIDSLRLSLQCSADTSLITFDWIEDYPIPWPNFSSTHKCRDWDRVLDFAHGEYNKMMSRARKGSSIKHPVLGVPTSDMAWKVPLREEDVHLLDAAGNRISRSDLLGGELGIS